MEQYNNLYKYMYKLVIQAEHIARPVFVDSGTLNTECPAFVL